MRQIFATNQPLVSVVIPAYNAEQFITQTLESVLAQSYSNLEILVVNDGSTDCTAEKVEWLAKQDARIQLFNQPNAGVAAARNLAIRQSHGAFVAVIDADDLWYCDQIAKQVDCFLTSPDLVGLVYSWSVDIDEQDRPLAGIHAAEIVGNVYSTLLCHNFLGNASCTMMRRSSLVQIGGYDEAFQAQNAYGCEDWDLYLRMAEQYEFRVVPEFLVGYRKLCHSMSYNSSRMARSHTLMLEGVERRHPQLSGWLYRLSRSSFYLYFGHQASEHGADQEAMRWLMQAIKSDITPWLRIGTYTLALKSWFRLRFNSSKARSTAVPQAHLPDAEVLQPTQSKVAPLPAAKNRFQEKMLESLTGASRPSQQAVLQRKPAISLLPLASPQVQRFSLKVALKVRVGKALHAVLSLLGE